jgi:hypothetical protein
MSRKGSDFPKIELLESCKKWQKGFFYVKNTTDVDLLNLPPYVDEPPLEMKNWTYNPKSTVMPVNALHRVKGELLDAGLTPQDIVACFISRRISPLQRRSHKICQMSGAMDPTRHSTHELTRPTFYGGLRTSASPLKLPLPRGLSHTAGTALLRR